MSTRRRWRTASGGAAPRMSFRRPDVDSRSNQTLTLKFARPVGRTPGQRSSCWQPTNSKELSSTGPPDRRTPTRTLSKTVARLLSSLARDFGMWTEQKCRATCRLGPEWRSSSTRCRRCAATFGIRRIYSGCTSRHQTTDAGPVDGAFAIERALSR